MLGLDVSTNTALMTAFLTRLDSAGAGACHFFGGVRPATGAAPPSPVVSVVTLGFPSGTINGTTGAFEFTPTSDAGDNGQVVSGTQPTWARFFDGAGAFVMDADVRLSGATDTGQEIIVSVATTYTGAFFRLSGGFTA